MRELVLKANPKAVPGLIHGNTLAELEASVPAAAAEYKRIADEAASAATTQTDAATAAQTAAAVTEQKPAEPAQPPAVPGGAAPVVVRDLTGLSGEALIKIGLEDRSKQRTASG